MKALIVYSSAGAGHKKAAEAIYKAYKAKKDVTDEVILLDMLEKSNWMTRRAYPGLYLFAIRHASWLWGFLFKLTDNRTFYNLTKGFKLFLELINAQAFIKYLKNEDFDVIISTHFYSSTVADYLKRKALIKSRLLTVVTDYRVHAFWLSRASDKFLVASKQTKDDLIKDNIDASRIIISGIPIELKFLKRYKEMSAPDKKERLKEDIEEKLGLVKAGLRVLIMGGGFGVGPYEYFLEHLAELKDKLSLAIICGYNEDLLNKLKERVKELDFEVDLFGYVNNVDELMQVSDLVITKAGGITLSEALAMGLPAVVINPIPGQEEGNAGYLSQAGALITEKKPQNVVDFIKKVIEDKSIIDKMRKRAHEISKPDAANKVVDIAREIS
jgi:processive 1,2-diacylglycerol beta-glucosyltransferase